MIRLIAYFQGVIEASMLAREFRINKLMIEIAKQEVEIAKLERDIRSIRATGRNFDGSKS